MTALDAREAGRRPVWVRMRALLTRIWVPLVATTILGTAFIVVVPPGLPYDEPSHWLNVLFYVDHLRMPVLGDPGVTYEAQMGPVAYVLDALVAGPLRAVAGDAAAFSGVRALGLVQHLVLAAMVGVLAGRALPTLPGSALVAVTAVGLNPMLLAMSTSVQNDTTGLVLACGALVIATAGPATGGRMIGAGLLGGLALLTKVTMWPVTLGIGVFLLVRRRFAGALVYGAVVTVVSGWWFVRNLVLYGDLTARAGVAASGYDFPALGPVSPLSIARSVLTYLWLPTEYVRNTVESPPVVDVLVVGLSVSGVVGLVLFVVHRARPPLVPALLSAIAVAAVVTWALIAVTTQAVAFRFAYAALPLWFCAVGALSAYGARRVATVLGAVLVGICAWFLIEVSGLPSFPFEISLSSYD